MWQSLNAERISLNVEAAREEFQETCVIIQVKNCYQLSQTFLDVLSFGCRDNRSKRAELSEKWRE
jgi:hypothetical protein